MRQVPRSPLSFKLQRVANVPEHPPPSTRLMSCAHIANRRLSRIIGARTVLLRQYGSRDRRIRSLPSATNCKPTSFARGPPFAHFGFVLPKMAPYSVRLYRTSITLIARSARIPGAKRAAREHHVTLCERGQDAGQEAI